MNTNHKNLTLLNRWSGKHKHISYEVSFHTNNSMQRSENSTLYPNNGIWTSYIIINRNQIPKEFDSLIPKMKRWNGREFRDYMSHDVCSYFDLNGGATFFESIRSESGRIVAFKIGNDYNHIWNHGGITFEAVQRDVISSIDGFIGSFPKYKAWSVINGNFYRADRLEYWNERLRNKKQL